VYLAAIVRTAARLEEGPSCFRIAGFSRNAQEIDSFFENFKGTHAKGKGANVGGFHVTH
jgi:hypothetical protein